jgi:uncharacterized protein (TIGR02246 family)
MIASGAAGAATPLYPPDVSAAVAVIDKVDEDWLAAMQAKDAERLAAPYAVDAVFLLPSGQSVTGRAAIADLYRRRFAEGSRLISGGIRRDGLVEATGGLVIEWGQGEATSVDRAGRQSTSRGPYVTIWKRSAEQRWVIIRNLVF